MDFDVWPVRLYEKNWWAVDSDLSDAAETVKSASLPDHSHCVACCSALGCKAEWCLQQVLCRSCIRRSVYLWLLVKLGHRCVKSNSVSMHLGQVTKYALRCCTNWTREIRWLLVQVHVRYVRVIYLVGYSISLLALTVAVAIMLHIKWVQFSALSSPFTATKAPHTHEQLSRAVNRSRERLIAA